MKGEKKGEDQVERKISRESSIVKSIHLKRIKGKAVSERRIHLKDQPKDPFLPILLIGIILQRFLLFSPMFSFRSNSRTLKFGTNAT